MCGLMFYGLDVVHLCCGRVLVACDLNHVGSAVSWPEFLWFSCRSVVIQLWFSLLQSDRTWFSVGSALTLLLVLSTSNAMSFRVIDG